MGFNYSDNNGQLRCYNITKTRNGQSDITPNGITSILTNAIKYVYMKLKWKNGF